MFDRTTAPTSTQLERRCRKTVAEQRREATDADTAAATRRHHDDAGER